MLDDWRLYAQCRALGQTRVASLAVFIGVADLFFADDEPQHSRRRHISKEQELQRRQLLQRDRAQRRQRANSAAIDICSQCIVSEQCLTLAMTYEQEHPDEGRFGIFGGHTPKQRTDAASHRRGARP